MQLRNDEKHINRVLWLLLVLSAVIRGFLAAYMEFSNDEVYYWTYALYPDWSHFDHPPMVGWVIQFFSLNLLLDSEFFIRLASIVLMTGCTAVMFRIGKEIKDALAYLRALSNPDDDVSVRRILNEPKRGIGAKSETVVADHASAQRISFFVAARAAAAEPESVPGLGASAVKKYAQFVKLDLDLAKTVLLEKDNTLALHLGFGLAFPYGNARHIPFELRYFAGGSNSVRGWSVRTLGPGSMKMTPDKTFFDQMGDIRLDLNVEYRTKLFWKFRAAAFVDAGNVWTIKEYENHQDGLFRFDRFYKEIALAYGLGLRLDFDYFLVRLDAGLKAYDPQQTGRYKWAITRPNLSSNFAWHIAVGYPF